MLIQAQNFSRDELRHLREAGKILASLFRDCRDVVHAGVSGRAVNDWFASEIIKRGAHATYLDKDVNFPGVICISPNDVVVHGVPKDTPFAKGDIVGFDLVVDVGGMKADAAFTLCVDETPAGAKKLLLATTEKSLYAGIDAVAESVARRGAAKIGDISRAVEKVLSRENLGIVRDLVGHGIGREMHEEPDVPNYRDARTDNITVPIGNAIAIEPMATLGGWKVVQDDPDGWSIRTRDGAVAAHFEHTILIGDAGAEIITNFP